MLQNRVELRDLYKIFGPLDAINLLKNGASVAEVRERAGAVVAINGVNLAIEPGEIFVIMGLSGSGKSTLIRCINRLIEPSSGNVLIDGSDITHYSPNQLREVRRHRISMVFQNFSLLPHRTVLENTEYGLALRKDDRAKSRVRALETLRLVGLENWADRYPDNLSGGMRQRVGLARALATDCDILLMDEPFSALDPLIRRELQDELIRLQKQLAKTIVFVTHDFQEATRIGNRIALMREGAVVQLGTPQDIVQFPVNDYVSSFSKDLDRSQLLRVADLMTPCSNVGSSAGAQVLSDRRLVDVYPLLAEHPRVTVVDERGETVGLLDTNMVFAALSMRETHSDTSRDEHQADSMGPPDEPLEHFAYSSKLR